MLSKLARASFIRSRHAALFGAVVSPIASHYSEPPAIRCSAFAEGAILLSPSDRATLAAELGHAPRAVIFKPSQIVLRQYVAQFREDVQALPLRLTA